MPKYALRKDPKGLANVQIALVLLSWVIIWTAMGAYGGVYQRLYSTNALFLLVPALVELLLIIYKYHMAAMILSILFLVAGSFLAFVFLAGLYETGFDFGGFLVSCIALCDVCVSVKIFRILKKRWRRGRVPRGLSAYI